MRRFRIFFQQGSEITRVEDKRYAFFSVPIERDTFENEHEAVALAVLLSNQLYGSYQSGCIIVLPVFIKFQHAKLSKEEIKRFS